MLENKIFLATKVGQIAALDDVATGLISVGYGSIISDGCPRAITSAFHLCDLDWTSPVIRKPSSLGCLVAFFPGVSAIWLDNEGKKTEKEINLGDGVCVFSSHATLPSERRSHSFPESSPERQSFGRRDRNRGLCPLGRVLIQGRPLQPMYEAASRR